MSIDIGMGSISVTGKLIGICGMSLCGRTQKLELMGPTGDTVN